LTPAQIQQITDNTIMVPSVDISSSSVRKLLTGGGDISEMVHPKVLDYIIKNRFYA
jgi:nicotinic acid mononucleotide adenylyltransferase